MQASHASQESGAKFGCPEHCHLVLISVKNENELNKVAERLSMNDIEHCLFYECDEPAGYTALCTRPLYGEERQIMKRYQMYR